MCDGSVSFAAFNAGKVLYSFELFAFDATDEQFSKFMADVGGEIQDMGSILAKQDLADNLLWLNSWSRNLLVTPTDKTLQSITFTGDATYMMTKDVIQGTIANVQSDCDIMLSTVSLNQGSPTLQFSYKAFLASPSCNNVLNPFMLGYNPSVTGDAFSITLGAKAIFAALATSHQVNGADTMSSFVTISEIVTGKYEGVQYTVFSKFDPNFPTMKPIFCLGPTNASAEYWNCFLRLSSKTYGIPFLRHAGASSTYPTPCDCSTNGHLPICDSFNLTFGAFIFDYSKNMSVAQAYPAAFRPFLPLLEFFYKPPANNGRDANRKAFSASWAAIFGQNISTFKKAAWRASAYEFSATPSYGTAAIVVVSVGSTWDFGVSMNKYQLTDGACADSVTSPHFHKLQSEAWGSLVEPYYR